MKRGKRNRKTTKTMSAVVASTTHLGVIVIAAFVMAMVYHIADLNNQRLQRSMGDAEKQLSALESDLSRTSSRWQLLRDPSRMDAVLLHHGLAMKLPRPDQNFRMRADGTPYPFAAKVSARRGSERADYTRGKRR